MPSAPDAVIGVDLGTSAVKVLAVTAAGREVASGAEFYGLETPHPDFVEQDADLVYLATMRVLERVLADVRLRGNEVVAIGFSAAMHGLLCVDEAGEPLSRVITWMDRRAHAVADRWRADGNGSALYARTGAPMHPMLPVAKLRWLAEHEPELFARTRRFVGLKELIVYRWTGEWLVDHGIASATGMLDLRTRQWDPLALQLAGVTGERLSRPAPPSTALPAFRPAIARELGLDGNVAVVLASADGPLANIGVGATVGGGVALTLGTSGAVRVLTDAPLLDPRGRTFCYCADDTRYVVGGPTSAAGASLDWIFALLLAELPKERRFARAAELAAEIAPGADGLVVLPFFAGERAPYWNSALRGAFDGLDLAHDRRTILRAGVRERGVRRVRGVRRAAPADRRRDAAAAQRRADQGRAGARAAGRRVRPAGRAAAPAGSLGLRRRAAGRASRRPAARRGRRGRRARPRRPDRAERGAGRRLPRRLRALPGVRRRPPRARRLTATPPTFEESD